jgi:hypothetical protein
VSTPKKESPPDPQIAKQQESLEQDTFDPQDSDQALDNLKGQTKLHAKPPRLEDEGQSGG